ncbi:SnoaL-like polyketide cyclase [Martelella mediterranea]|uniref:SnoaL-like polyketide cyclase n=1 Tax=Martelella mediterranea TaxID=293089 RepID=A0A4R3NTZ0_9HYPH|nr:SnoaL-like polyketide cyclase [Martelella mediterranea]
MRWQSSCCRLYHQVDTPHPGIEGFRASEEKNFAAFDDWKIPLVDLVAEGDQVAADLIFEGITPGCLTQGPQD